MYATALLRVALVSVLVGALGSQAFVVDDSGGPGVDFTNLPIAAATVPDGATLIVRPGNYSGFSSVGKGLTLLGEPGAVVSYPGPVATIHFSLLNANQRVIVKGLRLGAFYFPTYTVQSVGVLAFQSCLGPVHIEDCGATLSIPSPAKLQIADCSQVTVVRGVFSHGATFTASNVVCTDTWIFREQYAGLTGLVISGGKTQLVKCSVYGSSTYSGGVLGPPQGPGIQLGGGELRLLGPGVVSGDGGSSVSGAGIVRRDPSVILVGPSIPFAMIDEGALTSTAAPLGGTVTAKLEGSANLFGGIVIGMPRPVGAVPGVAEELWVEPIGFAISGQLGTPLTFWLDVPNDPALRGWMFGWQGVTLGPGGSVLSNPAWFCLH